MLGALSRALMREEVREDLLAVADERRAHSRLVGAVREAAREPKPTNPEG